MQMLNRLDCLMTKESPDDVLADIKDQFSCHQIHQQLATKNLRFLPNRAIKQGRQS